MAVPMTVKMPDPMTAPMPSAVSDHGPRDFFSACSGSSESLMSLSMDLHASSWLGRAVLLVGQVQCLQNEGSSCSVWEAFAAVYMMGIRAECRIRRGSTGAGL
jgi:hypothetical protein